VTIIGHKKQWEFLKNKFEVNQLSHAYLFTGASGIGKKTFIVEFAKLISCKSPSKESCGKCVNCQMIERNSFPDLKIVIKKPDKNEIDISQIREVQSFLSYKSYYGSFKIVAIDEAEKMNQEAQSCFLKTLEEPKGRTLLVLISSKPDMLLTTIASRCQTLKFFRPKELPINADKEKKDQDILKGLLPIIDSDLADKFKYAKSIDFDKQSLGEILEVMQRYFRGLLLAKAGIENTRSGTPALKDYPISKIRKVIDLIEDINNKILFTNANPKLALEVLLMEL
jgi:DNA polymerase III subunit delta'